MSKIMITGATGELGGLTIQHLLQKKNISKDQVVALVRKNNENLSQKGIELRIGDYDDVESLDIAFKGIEKLLVISSPSLDNSVRLQQLLNVIFTAKKNSVEHIVFVGLANSEKRLFGLEDVDMAIEHVIMALGITYTIMRNPVYLDEALYDFRIALKTGKLFSATNGKEFNFVLKSDLALANATVLSEDGHKNKIYDLSNDELMTYPELAMIMSEISGKEVIYQEKTEEEVILNMVNSNSNKEAAELLVKSFHRLISKNQFIDTSTDLKKLLGKNKSTKKQAIYSLLNK